ncbi:MAG: hypothetical protein ACXWWC_08655 [Chitinophagaceae bacterium]
MKINFLMAIVLASWVKENTLEIPLNDTVDTTMTMSGARGTFINWPYGSVSGIAAVYTIPNGPQLHVYLSKEVQLMNLIDLGALQSTRGHHFIRYRANLIFLNISMH